MQAQFLEHLFGVGDQQFLLRVTFLRPGEFEHLDFLELVLALQAARVLSCGARLGSKTCRPGAKLHRQDIGVERFLTIDAREFDLGRWREPKVRALEVEHIRRKFWQLTYASERRGSSR